jgi:subtilase family serine protease
MPYRRTGFLASAIVTAVAALGAAAPVAMAAAPAKVKLQHSSSPAASRTPSVGDVPDGTSIPFSVNLALSDPQGAQSFAQAVSTPGSSSYGKYLTAAQWEARYAPSAQSVQQVTQFLKSNGFTVGQVPADRLFVPATGTAAQIEKAFATSLAYHQVQGTKLRLASQNLTVPAGIAGVISGVSGVNQTQMHPNDTTGAPATRQPAATNGQNIPQPPGFRVAPPCGQYYNQQLDTQLPAYGQGYPANPPWAVCGYVPAQFRLAYGLTTPDSGTGVTVAVVDAYTSPTLFSDAHRYAKDNDPGNPLKAGQFSELPAKSYNDAGPNECDAPGWFGEETLDVEAVHATAPGANILVAGAKNCADGLITALNKVIQRHLADVVTNSYGDDAGDVLDSAGDRAVYDDMLQMAAGTGISVLFSSGDSGDEFTTVGAVAADYPASSPYATAVGGTTLAIGGDGSRSAEYGWSTARSFLCNAAYVAAGGCTASQENTWLPIDLSLDGGSGGGTSSVYPQPSYQAGVVPNSLSEANSSSPMRVEPDISMEADPATGILVGETQTFPDGVYYDTYRIGGTSVSSPLMAGEIARADQTAGKPLGFLNPAMYSLSGDSSAIYDVSPAGKVDQSRADFANSLDTTDGLFYTTRIVDYEGPEQYCSDATDPTTCSGPQPVALHATNGYDNMTGIGAPNSGFVGSLVAAAK